VAPSTTGAGQALTVASEVRLAEVIAALSIATDLGMGQPLEFALGSCILAVRLGDSLGLSQQELREVYYQALLRYVGCDAATPTRGSRAGSSSPTRRSTTTSSASTPRPASPSSRSSTSWSACRAEPASLGRLPGHRGPTNRRGRRDGVKILNCGARFRWKNRRATGMLSAWS